MNFFPFHIGDYAAHTRNLSLLEDLAYRRLLDAYYLSEQPFNGSPTDVAREIGMRDHVAEVEYILGKFFEQDAGSWKNKRADVEIDRYKAKIEGASKAGKASAERRLNGRLTNVQPTKNQEPEPRTKDIEPKGSLSSQPPVERTPSQKLLDVFHEKCQYLPRVSVFSEARKKVLKARFTEVMKTEKWTPEQTVEWFGDFYQLVNQSKFLTGRAPPDRNGRTFKADWDWVHAPSNFVKIIEGKYEG